MQILFDSNILLDYINNRKSYSDIADEIIILCADKTLNGYIAAHSLTNIFYILRKDFTENQRSDILQRLCKFLSVVSIDERKIKRALQNVNNNDFEDLLQIECAVDVGAEYIITRNVKDLIGSPVPVIEPFEFIERFY